MERVDKINYYLNIAEAISERGTCLRKNYGAIIVKNDEIISTGYTGAPRGRKNFFQMFVMVVMTLVEVFMRNKMPCLVVLEKI